MQNERTEVAKALTENDLIRKMYSDGWKVVELHCYQDIEGRAVYWKVRCEHETKGKWIRPFHNNGTEWVFAEPTFHEKKPLYNLPALVKEQKIFVVEGEKCVDALTRLGIVATTSGSSSSAGTANWEVLAGKDVFIWADNDAAGKVYCNEVCSILCDKSKLHIIQLHNDVQGYDCVDWLNDYPETTSADIHALPYVIYEKETKRKSARRKTEATYMPCNAELVKQECAVLTEFSETGFGDDEPLWRLALSVVRHCTDGIEIAHQWSSKASCYDMQETQDKLDDLISREVGPTLCETFVPYGRCKGCKYKGNLSSPISLGVEFTDITPTIDSLDARETERFNLCVSLAPKAKWMIGQEGIFKRTEEGVIPVISAPVYIVDIVCDDLADDTLKTAIIYVKLPHSKPTVFKLPLRFVPDDKRMLGEFVGRQVIVTNKVLFRQYLYDYLANMQHVNPQKVACSLGWQEDGSFIYSQDGECFLPDGTVARCLLDSKARSYLSGFKCKGDIKKWKQISQVYNQKKEFIPHYFNLLCSLGSFLLPFTAAKGFLISLHGHTSAGKTLAHKVAMSVWGDPEIAGCLGTQDTSTSLMGRLGAQKNLPVWMDEITALDKDELKGLTFMLVNGRGRSRSMKDGSLSSTASQWQTVSFVSTNNPLLENDMRVITEAERVRILEIYTKAHKEMDKIGRELDKLMHGNYGLAGKEMVNYYIKNKIDVDAKLHYYADSFQKIVLPEKRFWVSCGAIAFTAAEIAQKIGIIEVDLLYYFEWFKKLLMEQQEENEEHIKDARGFYDLEGLIQALLDMYNNRTKEYNENLEVISSNLIPEVVLRVIHEDSRKRKLVYVKSPVLKKFIRMHYNASYLTVLRRFGITKDQHYRCRRFGKDEVSHCYELAIEYD